MAKKFWKNEDGFNLIELIVVMLILGVIGAIAIPVFLNQTAKSNDSTVETDLKNTAVKIKAMLIDYPNAVEVGNGPTGGPDRNYQTGQVNVYVQELGGAAKGEVVNVSDGVYINVSGNSVSFFVRGYHTNGKEHRNSSTALVFDSAKGGIVE